MEDDCHATDQIAASKSSQDQNLISAILYDTFNDTAVDLEAQQNGTGALTDNNINIVQNVAYIVKPMTIPLSSNVAYESHVHQDTGNQDKYDYI